MAAHGLGVVVVCHGSPPALGELADRGECWRGSISGFRHPGGALALAAPWLLRSSWSSLGLHGDWNDFLEDRLGRCGTASGNTVRRAASCEAEKKKAPDPPQRKGARQVSGVRCVRRCRYVLFDGCCTVRTRKNEQQKILRFWSTCSGR